MTICIAGLKIYLQQDDLGSLGNQYKGFIVNNALDFNINLAIDYNHKTFRKNGQTPEFKASNWSIYWSNANYVIPIFHSPEDRFPYISLVCDKNFTDIKINVHKDNLPPELPFSSLDPLGFPADELILVNHMGKNKKGILIHAAGVIHEGNGYLFPGCSTAGKSTISRLFLNDGRATVLSDDRIVIRNIDDQFYIYGTPWHGEDDISSNRGAPLKSIYFLEKGKSNKVKNISQIDQINKLFQCAFISFWDKKQMDFNMDFLESVLQKIPAQTYYFQPGQKAVDYILDK